MSLRAFAVASMIVCLVFSSACRRGPDDAVLESTLQAGLDETFGTEVFRIGEIRRMGSASYRNDEVGGDGVYIYYDAMLELERDYSLTSWKGLNLGTLAFVVGATESGIEGFKPKGNAQGDRLGVHGRLPFAKDGDVWTRVETMSPVARKTAPGVGQDLRGSAPDTLLRGIRELLGQSPSSPGATKDAVIVGELRRAVSLIDLRVARMDGKWTLGAGPAGGTYNAFGAALGAQARRSGLATYSFESEGSLENASLIQDRTLDFALMQSDVAEVIHQGWSEEGILPNSGLRAVASLWPESVHLVTLDGSGIESVADLQANRVAVGQRGSGTRFNALRIGIAAGMALESMPELKRMSLLEGVDALESGEIEALFVTEAVPSPVLQALAARRDDVRFVSIDPDIVDMLSEAHFAYYPQTVEAHTYPGQDAAFRTLGLACTLMSHESVPADSVERLLELLIDEGDELSGRYFRAGFISADTMRLGLDVPLHVGAQRFYDAREAIPAAD